MEQIQPFLEAVRRQLKAERNAADLSLVALAEKSGVARSSLHLFEKGDRTPTLAQMIAITEALNVDIVEFMRRARERE